MATPFRYANIGGEYFFYYRSIRFLDWMKKQIFGGEKALL